LRGDFGREFQERSGLSGKPSAFERGIPGEVRVVLGSSRRVRVNRGSTGEKTVFFPEHVPG